MSLEDNKDLIRRYLDAISGNPKPRELIERFVTDPDLVEHILQSEAAFPKYRLEVEEMIAESDLVTVRGTVKGVNSGPLKGMPPTKRDVRFSIFITYRVADGKIVEHWMLTDNLTMMTQLGLAPAEEPATT